MEDRAPYLELSPGLEKDVIYPQKFVKAEAPKSYPKNHEAMVCPSEERVMKGIYYK